MKREDIVAKLEDSTVLSFPDRGPWGDKAYRGNCSGYVHAFLIWKYRIQKLAELFAGSGTGYDVAKDMGIDYTGADLNPTPVRPGILQVDAFRDDVPEAFYGADMVFMHPPYGAEIGIPYAGSMYPDPTSELSKHDLGQMKWDDFMTVLNQVIMKYYAAMDTGAYMSVLMGDVRRNGFHSMLADIIKPGELQQIIIKQQHNCVSYGRKYSNRNFVPITHEYIMVLKKIAPMMLLFQWPRKYKLDIRDSKTATWADVVQAVMKEHGGKMSLTSLYECIDGHKKTLKNKHWQAKIRQTLQLHSRFEAVGHGVWQLAD